MFLFLTVAITRFIGVAIFSDAAIDSPKPPIIGVAISDAAIDSPKPPIIGVAIFSAATIASPKTPKIDPTIIAFPDFLCNHLTYSHRYPFRKG